MAKSPAAKAASAARSSTGAPAAADGEGRAGREGLGGGVGLTVWVWQITHPLSTQGEEPTQPWAWGVAGPRCGSGPQRRCTRRRFGRIRRPAPPQRPPCRAVGSAAGAGRMALCVCARWMARVCANARVSMCVCACMSVRAYVHMCTHACVCLCVCRCVHVCVCNFLFPQGFKCPSGRGFALHVVVHDATAVYSATPHNAALVKKKGQSMQKE